MLRDFSAVVICLGILGVAADTNAQLMIPDIMNSRVMLFDAFDGSLIDESFIDMSDQGGFPVTRSQLAMRSGFPIKPIERSTATMQKDFIWVILLAN